MQIPKDGGAKPSIEAYYREGPKDFVYRTGGDEFRRVNSSRMEQILELRGFNVLKPKSGGLSEVNTEIIRIIEECPIDYVGPLAGYKKGFFSAQHKRILVTHDPMPGSYEDMSWGYLEAFLVGLLGDGVQFYTFCAWLKVAYESLLAGKIRPGQVLALVGEGGAGKSLLQEVVTFALGRVAKPFLWMSGGSQFNSELFASEHLMIGDELAETDNRARRQLGNKLKQLAAEPVHKYHAKGIDAFDLRPFWRCTISLNYDGENLRILPIMDKDIAPKIIVLECLKHPFLMPPGMTNPWVHGYKELLESEIPGLLSWLLSIEIPEDYYDERYGVAAYHAPSIIRKLDEHAPEERLWDVITEVVFAQGYGSATYSANELQSLLMGESAVARQVLYFDSACGVYLRRLEHKADGRVLAAKKPGVRNAWALNWTAELAGNP